MRIPVYLATIGLFCVSTPILACRGLEVSDAWVREPPPLARVAAAYFRLKNTTNKQITIRAVESTCCKHVMMHESRELNGRAQMAHLEELVVAAHATVRFEPGGKHLMLVSPQPSLSSGKTINVGFVCADDDSSSVEITVKRDP